MHVRLFITDWLKVGILFFLILGSTRLPASVSIESMSYAQLMELHTQLRQASDQNKKKIDRQSQQIIILNTTVSSIAPPPEPFCNIANKSTSRNSSVLGNLSFGLSVASTVFTIIGPIGELYHDYTMYHKGTTPIPPLAFGQPACDCLSNACYVIHLGLNSYNGGNFWTFLKNAFPSIIVMVIETGIMGSLVFYGVRKAKRTPERQSLLPHVD